MLAKNRPEVILDDGKLDDTKSDYLVALRDDFLLTQRGASFQEEPYSPIGLINSLVSVSKFPGYF